MGIKNYIKYHNNGHSFHIAVRTSRFNNEHYVDPISFDYLVGPVATFSIFTLRYIYPNRKFLDRFRFWRSKFPKENRINSIKTEWSTVNQKLEVDPWE